MTYNIWSGSKIRLRPVVSSDWERFHLNDQDSECARLCDAIYFPRSEDGTKTWAEKMSAKEAENDNVFLAIETLEGILVGSICTNSCNIRNGTFKYGLAVFREYRRNGYASEAIRILLNYYFEELYNIQMILMDQHLFYLQILLLKNFRYFFFE